MTHQEIQDNEIIERYVLHKLSVAERRAFQEHIFECDECFEQSSLAARFIAGVRDASRSGVLAPDPNVQPHVSRQWLPGFLTQSWAMPALAFGLLVAVALIGLWGISLKRENQRLAAQATEQSRAPGALSSEQVRSLESRIRELEASSTASEKEKESLRQEISKLKEELTATTQPDDTQVAQLKQPEVNVPVRNIYPVDDVQRSGGASEVNQLQMPRGTRIFVLILGDYKPGHAVYRLEISDPSGRRVSSRTGLRPDQNGELSVMLNRTQLNQGKYRLKLYAGREAVAEYVVEVK